MLAQTIISFFHDESTVEIDWSLITRLFTKRVIYVLNGSLIPYPHRYDVPITLFELNKSQSLHSPRLPFFGRRHFVPTVTLITSATAFGIENAFRICADGHV